MRRTDIGEGGGLRHVKGVALQQAVNVGGLVRLRCAVVDKAAGMGTGHDGARGDLDCAAFH